MSPDEAEKKPKRRRTRSKVASEAAASPDAARSPQDDAGVEDEATRAASDEDAASSADVVGTEAEAPADADEDQAPADADVPDIDTDPEGEEAEEPEAEAADDEEPKSRRPRRRRGAKEPAAPARRRRERPAGPPPVVRAQAKYVRSSPRKARLVCDHIRGKTVEEARAILAHTPRAVARDWSKLLESAVANAEHNHELVGEDLYVKAVHADDGPTIKRFQPRAMGRATKIRKRTSHLTILLTPKD
jgi:ribosomal protein L22